MLALLTVVIAACNNETTNSNTTDSTNISKPDTLTTAPIDNTKMADTTAVILDTIGKN